MVVVNNTRLYLLIGLYFLLSVCPYYGNCNINNMTANIKSPPKMEPKIVGGVIASHANNMHQVSLRIMKDESKFFGQGHICGGSLISSTAVLTAAHCLFKQVNGNQFVLRAPFEFTVVMGTLNRFVKTNNTLQYDVKEFVYHKLYNADNFDHDIAILKLVGKVPDRHPTVRPINLVDKRPSENDTCQISGWGALGFGQSSAIYLLTANVTVLNKNLCNQNYNYMIKASMFCAGDWEGRTDSCQGDSGGPLTYNGRQAGVVSWGYECGHRSYPGVYTDVAYFKEWIQENGASKMQSINLFLILSIIGYNLFIKCYYTINENFHVI